MKSVWEEASFALDDNALVRSLPELDAALAERRRRLGGEWFAETFIEGREFSLSLLAAGGKLAVLPPAEICFDDFPPGKARIVGYKAKWDTAPSNIIIPQGVLPLRKPIGPYCNT